MAAFLTCAIWPIGELVFWLRGQNFKTHCKVWYITDGKDRKKKIEIKEE
jgi:hypothetical protein